jgi:mannitol/fructose-specific phosphotransferase system IIA component (Ntr-type)
LRLIELLDPARVRVPLVATEKDALLRELVDLVIGPDGGDRAAQVLGAVLERETVLSTGIGGGVAIPHAKTDAVASLSIAAGRTAAGIDYDALDGEPVRLCFLLVGPESDAAAHVKALSRIARVVRRESVRERLGQAADAEEFLRVLDEAESA